MARWDRFTARSAQVFRNAARRLCCCCRVDTVQYLDVRARDYGNAVVGALITVHDTVANADVAQGLTDDTGDIILRVPVSSYSVAAEKLWHLPIPQVINVGPLAAGTGQIVNVQMESLRYYLHVDADRDGNVDAAHPQPGVAAVAWAWGAHGQGAIILCNNDTDDNAPLAVSTLRNPDNRDAVVNQGNDGTHELAPLEVRRHGSLMAPPVGWTATLAVTAGVGFVRVLGSLAAGQAQVIFPGTANIAIPLAVPGPASYAGNIFGVEALQFADGGFNGLVTFRLTVADGAGNSYFTEVEMRVAPWLMPNHSDAAHTVYVADVGQVAFLGALGVAVGNAVPAPNLNVFPAMPGGDRWMQDCVEIGYSNYPGSGAGAVRLDTYVKAVRQMNFLDLRRFPRGFQEVQVGNAFPAAPTLAAQVVGAPSPAAIAAAVGVNGTTGLAVPTARLICQAAADAIARNACPEEIVAAAAYRAAVHLNGGPLGVPAAQAVGAAVAAAKLIPGGLLGTDAAVLANIQAAAGGNVAAAAGAAMAATAYNVAIGGPGALTVASMTVPVVAGGGVVSPTLVADTANAVGLYGAPMDQEAALAAYATAGAAGMAGGNSTNTTQYGVEAAVETDNAAWTAPNVTTTYDSFGNLEVTPPVRSTNAAVGGANDYRWGRIYHGTGTLAQPFNANVLQFLQAQQVQEPIALNTNWLQVGHVDEMMTFIPANSLDPYKRWKLLVASPTRAYAILNAENAINAVTPVMGGRNLTSVHTGVNAPVNTTVGAMMGGGVANMTFLTPWPGLTWAELRQWNLGPVQNAINAVLQVLTNEIGLNPLTDVIEVPIVFYPVEYFPVALPLPLKAAALASPVGVAGGMVASALTAGMVNMLVINNHLVIPRAFGPLRAGNDQFQVYLDQQLGAMVPAPTWNYVDDWNDYHDMEGEIHCGTNTWRRPANVGAWLGTANARWWEYPG